ncbi:MAG: MFS transporter [Gemmatimonadota bacterium]
MSQTTAPAPVRDTASPSPRSDAERRAIRSAWYTVAVLTLANVSGFVDRQILSLLVVPIKRDLGVSDTQVSLLMGLSFVVFYSLLGLPIGRWVDSGPRKVIVALGAAVWSVLTMASGLARTFGGLFVARVGVGVGEATLQPAAISLIADAFPRRRLGTAMSVFMLGTFFGSGVAYALGAYVVGEVDRPGLVTLPLVGSLYPWQTVFFIVGLPGLLVALLALTMREPARGGMDATQVAGTTPTAAATVRVPVSQFIAYLRANARAVTALSLGFACSASVNYGIGAWLATFFVRTHGWTIQRAGTLQGALTMTVGVLGTLAGGRLTDHWARKGRTDAPILVGMLGAAGMLVTATAYPLVSSPTAAALLLIPVNLFAAMPWGAASAAVAEAMPSRMRGQGGALYQLVVNLVSGALGPTSVALLTDRVFGDEASLRYSLALCTVVGMTLTLLLLQWGRPAFRRTVEQARG